MKSIYGGTRFVSLTLLALSCFCLCSISAFLFRSINSLNINSIHRNSQQRHHAKRTLLFASSITCDGHDHGQPLSTTTGTAASLQHHHHLDAVVCGGGPAGLLSAIMLAQRFPRRHIHVFETTPHPPLSLADHKVWNGNDALARFYTLGVFGRGKRALEHFGVWDSVQAIAQELVGSQAWRSNSTSTITAMTNNSNATPIALFQDMGREPIYALPRDKLVSALYQHIQERYASQIHCHFGQAVTPISFDYYSKLNMSTDATIGKASTNGSSVLLDIGPSEEGGGTKSNSNNNDDDIRRQIVTTDFLIGADGAARTVANRMEQVEEEEWAHKNLLQKARAGRPFRVTRFPDTNPRVYKTIPVQLPPEWRRDIGYSASNSNDKDRRCSIVSLPANTEGGLCAVMLMKAGDPMAQPNTDPNDLREMLNLHVPVFSNLVDDKVVATVAQKAPSAFPFFRYAGPRLHKGDRTVILGDACHSVKPYNGLGVNSAFEDVRILSDILEETSITAKGGSIEDNDNHFWKTAVESFSKTRAKDCKAVVTLSRAGDRPGRLGKLSYLVPLLMDALFHKVCPLFFTPPIPGLMHDDKYRFHQVALRKRWERLAQVSILSLTASLVWRLLCLMIQRVAMMGLGTQKQSTITLGLLGPTVALLIGRKLLLSRSG